MSINKLTLSACALSYANGVKIDSQFLMPGNFGDLFSNPLVNVEEVAKAKENNFATALEGLGNLNIEDLTQWLEEELIYDDGFFEFLEDIYSEIYGEVEGTVNKAVGTVE